MLKSYMDPNPGGLKYSASSKCDTMEFPFFCTSTGKFDMGDKYYTERDGLDGYLLIITTDGCGKMFYRDKTCLLKKNSAVLIDTNLYQRYETQKGNSWQFYYLHFTALSMKGYEALTQTLAPVILESANYCCELMEQLYNRTHRMDVLSYAAQSNSISNLLTEMMYALDTGNKRYLKNIISVTDLAEYIRKHCTENLHLDDFVRISNTSKHHLIRVFEKQFGVTPYKYMHICRINRAQNLLLNTGMPVSEIALETGYSDTVLFIRHFRAVTSVSPGQYRKNLLNK